MGNITIRFMDFVILHIDECLRNNRRLRFIDRLEDKTVQLAIIIAYSILYFSYRLYVCYRQACQLWLLWRLHPYYFQNIIPERCDAYRIDRAYFLAAEQDQAPVFKKDQCYSYGYRICI